MYQGSLPAASSRGREILGLRGLLLFDGVDGHALLGAADRESYFEEAVFDAGLGLVAFDVDRQNDGSAETSPVAFTGKPVVFVDFALLFANAADREEVTMNGDFQLLRCHACHRGADDELVVLAEDVHGKLTLFGGREPGLLLRFLFGGFR